MRPAQQWVGNVGEVRQRLIGTADVRDQVAFQNDVNALLAAVGDLESTRSELPHGIEATFGLLPARPQAVAGDGRPARTRAVLAHMADLRRVGKAAMKAIV